MAFRRSTENPVTEAVGMMMKMNVYLYTAHITYCLKAVLQF